MELTLDKLRAITERPIVAILATVNPSGSPQATPIWYLYDHETHTFNVTCHAGRVKARNVRRNPKVSLVIVDTVGPGDPLIVNGTAEVIEEGAEELTYAMACRYEGEAKGTAQAEELIDYARRIGEPRVIIRITPEKFLHGA